ncbi:hypothetical protein CPAR01_15702 [Colletotrichum paranaense]|uniref:Uncharacterized protein n=5 Tax=Colletotrichum acutatum species complex TaxID=2707335 RepID=A0A9Q0AWH8_9PEZI|nr:uncharacterized protein CLUP02_01372 [Colletotrichum lupini]XP_060341526.1 uncharacterized protein CPAR01_15702 [Colletotrichum paranaense]XP_060386844.1 uncharacterized protein CTAM01_02172 [Colletotrichum tamarilloi]XP_060398530.1 uncharacterized protein CABS01_10899 [Colletotrichum abscissum]KAI3552328.1 hypothetical protein CSPX01_00077 [Colletotrichum filicis]KAK1459553.1 hypothetical protein CMEL01_02552 [Colletotrichum melonis]KAI3529352.1 hypothetical protein CABS02_14847 [Colletot
MLHCLSWRNEKVLPFHVYPLITSVLLAWLGHGEDWLGRVGPAASLRAESQPKLNAIGFCSKFTTDTFTTTYLT